MKLDIKKTGLIVAASSAFMVAGAFAESSVYGKFGIDLIQTSAKANKDADSVGGLSFADGGNRFGFTGTKEVGGAVESVTGNLEFGTGFNADSGGTTFGGRHANVMIKLASGGTLGLGQQDNLRVGSGWNSNAWGYQASALNEGRAVNGARYTGVSYSHGFGIGSIGVMLGIDDTDNGSKGSSSTSDADDLANNAIDKMTVRLSLNPLPELGVQIGIDTKSGDLAKGAETKSVTALSLSYSLPVANIHFGYGMLATASGDGASKVEGSKTDMSLNAALPLGDMTPFVGFRQTAGTNKSGGVSTDLKQQTAISLGVNLSVLGGAAFAGYDSVSNEGGVDGASSTRIMGGLYYSF